MAKVNLTISGYTPSLKNSKQIFMGKGGRPFITSSNASKEWRSKAVWELLAQSKGKRDTTYPLKVKLTFWRSTKRRFDPVANAEVTMGVLSYPQGWQKCQLFLLHTCMACAILKT